MLGRVWARIPVALGPPHFVKCGSQEMEGWSEGGTQQQQERWQSRTWDPENRLDSSYRGISNLCPTILCYTQPQSGTLPPFTETCPKILNMRKGRRMLWNPETGSRAVTRLKDSPGTGQPGEPHTPLHHQGKTIGKSHLSSKFGQDAEKYR